MAKKTRNSIERHALALAKKPDADLDQAADTFVELFAKTGDLDYAKDCWRMALGFPKSAAELLPDTVVLYWHFR